MAGEETENDANSPALRDGITEVIETDFKEKTVRKITVSEDTKPSRFLRDCAKYAKENKVKSVLVLMIDDSDHCDWIMEFVSEHHACLTALCLEDVREDVKFHIFGDTEVAVE